MDLTAITGSFISGVSRLINGIKTLAVPRLEDLPYWTSPPIQFVYESTATLALGNYIWNDPPTALVPNRPIRPNFLYYFRNITLSADIEELDFTANIVTSPQFFTFLDSTGRAVLFREPLVMNKFYQQFDYRLVWRTLTDPDTLRAAFVGQLVQGPGLIGKASITLKAIISAQEIVDDGYVKQFVTKYPAAPAPEAVYE